MHKTLDLLHQAPESASGSLHVGMYEAPAGQDFPPHQHPVWELVYYRAGRIGCVVDRETFEGYPGLLVLTPPRTVHAELAWTAYANTYLTIDLPREYPWPLLCIDDAANTISHIFTQLFGEYHGNSAHRREMLNALILQLDVLLSRWRRQESLSREERLISEVERLMAERFACPLSIQQIAREVGIAPSTLRTQFARARGKTPSSHLQEIRVRHALYLLRTSDITLESVAGQCGYDSASHLSRHIKRATGKSPGSLRR
jgi:AraC-like DNA-binding protein